MAAHVRITAPGEVDHLLPGDFTGRGADSFAFNAMVGGKQHVAGVLQGGAVGLLDEADLQGNLFQPS